MRKLTRVQIVEAEFEAMSVYQAKRLKAEGRGGLMVLPGVQQLLATVRLSSLELVVPNLQSASRVCPWSLQDFD